MSIIIFNCSSNYCKLTVMSALKTILFCQCPNCEKANVFVDPNPYHLSKMTKMQSRCPNCDFNYENEVGFHYLSMYMSYAISVAISLLIIVGASLIFGLDYFLYYITINAILLVLMLPLIFRWARMMSIWLTVKYAMD